MQTKHIASLLQEGYTTVQVLFPGTSKRYTYKYRGTILLGDHAIVSVSGMFKIVEVVQVDRVPQIDVNAPYAYKWIVQRIDDAEYHRLMQVEEEFAETLKDIAHQEARNVVQEEVKKLLKTKATRNLFKDAVERLKND